MLLAACIPSATIVSFFEHYLQSSRLLGELFTIPLDREIGGGVHLDIVSPIRFATGRRVFSFLLDLAVEWAQTIVNGRVT